MDRGHQILLSDVKAALNWWREAGVDCVFDDAPRRWIVVPDSPPDVTATPGPGPTSPVPIAAKLAAPLRTTIGGKSESWPGDLSAFAEWWQSEPSLDGGQLRARVPPRGPKAARLMVIASQPEAEDSDTLLSGPQGRLLAAMLSAMGIAAQEVYFASALTRHTPAADWADLAAQGLGDVLRQHVTLVQPQRLLAFGSPLAKLLAPQELEPPLSGNAPAQIVPNSPFFGEDGASVPLLVARDLGSLLERPIAKSHFWQHWLEWSAC